MYAKKLKLSDNLNSSSHNNEPSTSDGSAHVPECWLSKLPAELLRIIFSYLTPRELMIVRTLGIERFTQIEEKELKAISSLPNNCVSSMVLIMTSCKELLLNYMERIKLVTAKSLQQLIIRNEPPESAFAAHVFGSIEPAGKFLCDIITKMTFTCLNIQVLNLSEIHFDVPLEFSSIYCLTKLKTLSLSACVLSVPAFTTKITLHPQVVGFEGLVLNCTNIQHFSFYGCKCDFGPTDDAIMSIYKWKKLTHLTFSGMSTLRTCRVLWHVAESCHHFTSIELSDIGGHGVCHYIASVIHVLRMAKELTFLRINQAGFQLIHSLFWKSIELARNLQGLCLRSGLPIAVENRVIIEPLRKLPFLHLFHLAAKRICGNLPAQVLQIMAKNQVQAANIAIETYREEGHFRSECKHFHFPVI